MDDPVDLPTGITSLGRTIAGLRRASNSQGGRNLETSSIGQDIRLGKLPSGETGIAQKIGDVWVPLVQVMQGFRAVTATNSVDISTPANTATGYQNIGPTITVETYTGQITVIAHCSFFISGNKAAASISANIQGAVAPTDARSPIYSFEQEGQGMQTQLTQIETHYLAPGTYSINLAMKLYGGPGDYGACNVSYSQRSLTVFAI